MEELLSLKKKIKKVFRIKTSGNVVTHSPGNPAVVAKSAACALRSDSKLRL